MHLRCANTQKWYCRFRDEDKFKWRKQRNISRLPKQKDAKVFFGASGVNAIIKSYIVYARWFLLPETALKEKKNHFSFPLIISFSAVHVCVCVCSLLALCVRVSTIQWESVCVSMWLCECMCMWLFVFVCFTMLLMNMFINVLLLLLLFVCMYITDCIFFLN